MRPPELPAGLRAAPVTQADAAEVAALWRACELHDEGRADLTDEDFIAWFARPSFDLATQAVGVRDGAALVAFAARASPESAEACVLPSHRGRGVGAALMRWTWEVARALGDATIGQPVSENAPDAAALLEAHGYSSRWTVWVLERELASEPAPPELPPGYAIREFVPGQDDEATFRVIEDAFAEWPDRPPEEFADWAAETLGRPGFAPSQLALAVAGDDVVGAVVLVPDFPFGGWVDQLAVERSHRGRGLGRALLQHAFGAAWRQGRRRCGLGTDSRTGAIGLYERVGMRVYRTYTHYAREL